MLSRKLFLWIGICSSLALVNASGWAQMRRPMGHGDGFCRSGGPGQGWSHLKMQNFEGVVQGVEIEENCMGERSVLRLKVKGAAGEFEVHVAPVQYLEGEKLTFVVGDVVKGKGFYFSPARPETLMATELVAHGRTLTLRDEMGRPVWRLAKAPMRPGRGPDRQ